MSILPRKHLVTALKILLGISILFVIFLKIGYREIWLVFKEVDLIIIPVLLVCHILTILIGALSQWILIRPLYKIPYFEYLRCYYPAWAIGLFAPGKIGEASVVYFLSKKGISPGHGTAILVFEKFISFSVVGLLASLGFFLFFPFQIAIKFLGLVMAIAIVALIMILSPFGRNIFKKFILRKHQDIFTGFSKTIFTHLRQHKRRVAFCFFLSLFQKSSSFL